MKLVPVILVSMLVIASVIGCATKNRVAQVKTIEAGGQKFDLGGTYNPTANELVLTIDGDPVMRGSFPRYTPTLRLNANYKNQTFSASCYFGSVLSGGRDKIGIIAGTVQGGLGKGGDKCEIATGSAKEELFF